MAQDCIITEEDCGTDRGINVRASSTPASHRAARERVLGRTAVEDIVDPLDGKVVIVKGQLIERRVELIDKAGIEEVRIRSVLTCEHQERRLRRIYGRDLARGTKVNIGEAVGVIAAQSIGEPGTQLTMRTFHIGGAAQRGASSRSSKRATTARCGSNRNIVKNSRRLGRDGPQHGAGAWSTRRTELATHRVPLRRATAGSTRGRRSSAARASPSGIPTPCRS